MKKKSIKDFKKLDNKDLKKIKGGEKHYVNIGGEWVVIEY